MQSPAEKELINQLVKYIKKRHNPKILNIGANTSLVIENELLKFEKKFICDRIDIIKTDGACKSIKNIQNCYTGSVEDMKEIENSVYELAFANFVFEHVKNLDVSCKETARIIKNKGILILSIPNPSSPEFMLSKITPTWFHQLIKGKGKGNIAHQTEYAYVSIKDIEKKMNLSGFRTIEIKYFANTYGYLAKFPILNIVSRAYDNFVNKMKLKALSGSVCLVLEKK